MCQKISACLKLNRSLLAIVCCYNLQGVIYEKQNNRYINIGPGAESAKQCCSIFD